MKLKDIFSSSADVKPPRIAVVGDVMLDCHIHCSVTGLSPEDELALKLQETMTTYKPGGAANVAVNLTSLGADVTLIGLIGDDPEGKKLCHCLGNEHSGLFCDVTRPTTVKRRYLTSHGRHIVRIDREAVDNLPEDILERFKLMFLANQAARPYDMIVVSDYAKGVVTSDLMEMLRSLGSPIVVDPKGDDFLKYGPVYAITPNRKEALAALRSSSSDTILRMACDSQYIVMTKSENGCALFYRISNERYEQREVFNTRRRAFGDPTGCGDSFVAALAYALSKHWSIELACQVANAAGAVTFDFTGAHAVNRSELCTELSSFNYEGKP